MLNQEAPKARELRAAFLLMTPKKRIMTSALITIALGALMFLTLYVNSLFLVEVPAYGGTLTEGVIGFPRLINPLFLTKNDAERDIAALTYSGLMRVSKEGTLEGDLAKNYSISDDGRTYTFSLRDDLVFHDGANITSGDVVFTIKKAQDPLLKSPRRAQWEGVTVEAADPQTIVFTLPQPYAGFLENTTIGILPQHIWSEIAVDEFSLTKFNEEPVGSGPYKYSSSKRDRSGIPTQYTFDAFEQFALGMPYIDHITVRFYPNEEELKSALTRGEVESAVAISAQTASMLETNGSHITSPMNPLPRVFAVFFNQDKQTLFTDSSIRRALSLSVPRESLIDQVLKGYATALYGPLPSGVIGFEGNEISTAMASTSIDEANSLLEAAGWKYNEERSVRVKDEKEFAFTLVTANTQEFKESANALKVIWQNIGARVTVNVFEQNDLTENIIRPREYDALFFGQAIGRDPDPFSFWHSSQRIDPGLNVALYANITVDSVLERARVEIDNTKRASLLQEFQDEIATDVPAVFIYAPHLLYVVPAKLGGADISLIAQPSERFSQIHRWFIETDNIWKIFTVNG